MGRSYRQSVLKALKNGFRPVDDPKSYRGIYFMKKKLKWIHDIDELKSRLGIRQDKDLTSRGYDVNAYYQHNS